jgi:hypothetical protein
MRPVTGHTLPLSQTIFWGQLCVGPSSRITFATRSGDNVSRYDQAAD